MSEPYSLNEKIYQRLLLLQAHDEFMDEVLTLRKLIENATNVEIDDDGNPYLVYDETAPNVDIEIKKIRDKYKLSNAYDFSLRHYVEHDSLIPFYKVKQYTANIIPRFIPQIDEPSFYISDETGEDEVHLPENWGAEQFVAIEIFPETELRDIIDNWDEISKERDLLYGTKNKNIKRSMRSNTLERDLEMFRLRKQGKTDIQIVEAINSDERFNKGKLIGYVDVPKIRARLYERLARIIPNKKN